MHRNRLSTRRWYWTSSRRKSALTAKRHRSPKEFEILLLLLQNKGRVFSREDILNRIWSDEVYVLDRTIDVNITRLRKKIGVYGKCIVTRLGYGYCFEAE